MIWLSLTPVEAETSTLLPVMLKFWILLKIANLQALWACKLAIVLKKSIAIVLFIYLFQMFAQWQEHNWDARVKVIPLEADQRTPSRDSKAEINECAHCCQPDFSLIYRVLYGVQVHLAPSAKPFCNIYYTSLDFDLELCTFWPRTQEIN